MNDPAAGFNFEFVRGNTDSTVYKCALTQCVLLHHVDDGRVYGPEKWLTQLRSMMKKHLDLKECG